MREKHQYSEERIDFIVGMAVVLVALLLFGFLVARIGRNMKTNAMNVVGEITTLGETRRGSEQTFTYELDATNVKEGERVSWIVNGEEVYVGEYAVDEAITFNYTPQQTGKIRVVAKVGKYTQATEVDILQSRLTLRAPDVTIVYGDELPELTYAVDGFIFDDGLHDFSYDGKCVAEFDKLNVGVYQIGFDKECCYKDYETNYVYGTLTVLPKQLDVEGNFVKTYDATNTIENPELRLVGVVEGDEVCAECDTLYFDNKNAGRDKMIMLGNVCLVGEDACNYVLPDFVCGSINPKLINVIGLTVKNKLYDGTTKATIDKMGSLSGVIDGDSVAIGNISVNFDDAKVGKRNVIAHGVTLIGADKGNYVIQSIETQGAEIANSTSFWDKILDREPIAQGNK